MTTAPSPTTHDASTPEGISSIQVLVFAVAVLCFLFLLISSYTLFYETMIFCPVLTFNMFLEAIFRQPYTTTVTLPIILCFIPVANPLNITCNENFILLSHLDNKLPFG